MKMSPEPPDSGLRPHSAPAEYAEYSSGLRCGRARSRSGSELIFVIGLLLVSNTVRAQDASVVDADAAVGDLADAGAIVAASRDAAVADAAVRAPAPEPEEPLPVAHRPRVLLTVTPHDGLMTGDLVHVSIRADALLGDDVTVPQQSFAPFEAHSKRARVEPARDGRQTYVFEIELLALEPGEHTLPALRLRVVTADGTVGSVLTNPVPVRIRSVLGNEPNAQPKPATRPVVVMQDDYTLPWALGALGVVLLTILMTWLVARWWSRRAKAAVPPAPPRPPWDVALEKLDAVRREARQLLTDGRERELVDRTSDALREYLGGRYGFDGLESTTDEILARLKKADVRGVSREEIAALLGDSDLVKFAKAVPDEAQCEGILAGAYRVVRATASAGVPAPGNLGGGPAGAVPGAMRAGHVPGLAPVSPAAARDRAGIDGEDDARVTAQTDGSLVVTMAPRSAFSVSRALEPAVHAALQAHATDINFSGAVRVFLAPELPDDGAAREAIIGTLARLATALREVRTARGMRVSVTLEHLHETPQPDMPVRKSVYEMPTRRGEGAPS